MIDPTEMTRYGRSHIELEETIFFSVLAANSNAVVSAKSLDTLLREIWNHFFNPRGCHKPSDIRTHQHYLKRRTGPFELIRLYLGEMTLNELRLDMRQFGIGKHGVKSRAFADLAHSGLNLKICATEDLEVIHGIGRKTSRFFILHTRQDAKVAALDTHILAYMRDRGMATPKNTPSSAKRYREIEGQFLQLAEQSGKTVADFDLAIWREYSKNGAKE